MGFEDSKFVWKNGEFVAWGTATVHVSAHGLHYGSGVFEGIRCYGTQAGPAVFRMDGHLERLYASAAVYGIEIPYTQRELSDAACELIRRNRFRSCYLRPICFYGSDSLAVHPLQCPVEVAILAWPWAPLLGADNIEKGVRVTVSPWTKFHSSMLPTTAKAGSSRVGDGLANERNVKRRDQSDATTQEVPSAETTTRIGSGLTLVRSATRILRSR